MALLNIRPTDRYERFLARMAGDGSVAMPIPRDKKEKFMKAIAENINRGGSGGSGASPYDLAVESGFVGTVEEWLASLKGSDGKDGATGATGAKGDTGDKGDKGDTGADGVGIVDIAKTNSSGLVDTYTITLSNGTTKTFDVKNGADTKRKAIITIVADGTEKDIETTGILELLESENIPLCMAINEYQVGFNKKYYTLDELHELQNRGVEIFMRSCTNGAYTDGMTVDEFRQDSERCKEYALENGFEYKFRVYPQGIRISDSSHTEESITRATSKMEVLKELGVEMAFNLESTVEMIDSSKKYPIYNDWYTYANGYNASYGLGNVIPFVTMPNGISKQYYLNRFDFTRAHITDEERKSHLLEDISNNQYITFLIHANLKEWTTADESDNKTTLDLLRETIVELKNTYGDQIEWRTASGAINSISDIPITKADVENMIGDVIDKYIKDNSSSEGDTNTETTLTEDIDFAFLLE